MRNAFNMIELVFIIVVMGILAKVGSSFIPDNRLLNDTNYISMKIKEQQKNALGYDTMNFSTNTKMPTVYSSDFNHTCVESSKLFLENLDLQRSYILTSTVNNTVTFCFDSLGRPYDKNATSEKLLFQKVDINVSYNNKTNTISVLPMSGYVIINQNP